MYGELASVQGIVDLSPQEALDSAEGFLASQGYIIEQRTFTTIFAQRQAEGGEDLYSLTVAVAPQAGGGVRVTIRGSDEAGVRERQAAWAEWSESLPKRTEPADVPLSEPPQVESADLPSPPQAPPTQGWEPTATPTTPRRGRSLGFWALLGAGGCLVMVVLLVGLVGLLAALGGSGGMGGSSGSGGPGSGETFTRENYGVLFANPDEHRGATVDVTGQLLDSPESQGNQVAFQMWADPVKVDWNTIVRTDKKALRLGTDDYAHVRGTVLGSFEGQNAFGGDVSAVEVEAEEVERVDAMAAIDPTLKTVEVDQTGGSEGFSVTLNKIEFGPTHTRVYLTARNDSDKVAKFDF